MMKEHNSISQQLTRKPPIPLQKKRINYHTPIFIPQNLNPQHNR